MCIRDSSSPDVAPGKEAQVKIPMMANADAVEIKAVNHEGEEIMTWSRGVKSEERRVKNSSAPSTSSAAYADQADAVEVKAGGRTYRFAKKDGRLMGVEVGSKAISLSNGPRFMAARRSDRSLDQFYNHDEMCIRDRPSAITCMKLAGNWLRMP